MEKKLVNETVFRKTDDHHPIKFGEINIELQPDDVILTGFDEGSRDAYYYLEVNRDRLETDEEFATRCQRAEVDKIWSRERRYENYLNLKKEFENGK